MMKKETAYAAEQVIDIIDVPLDQKDGPSSVRDGLSPERFGNVSKSDAGLTRPVFPVRS